MQVSQRESKDGSDAKLEASKTFSRVIAAGLHRVASAMAKDGECISKASKVTSEFQCTIQTSPCCNLPEGAECEHALQGARVLLSPVVWQFVTCLFAQPQKCCLLLTCETAVYFTDRSHAIFCCTVMHNATGHRSAGASAVQLPVGSGLVAAPADSGKVSAETSTAVADQNEDRA